MNTGRPRKWMSWIGIAVVLLSAAASTASPLDLSDLSPRWVSVRFETSPHEAPGRLDETWGAPRRAFIEPVPAERAIRIRVPASELVAQLRSTGADPVEGSFSDFVWTLDPETGHVLRAEMAGEVRETFAFGFIRTSAVVTIRVEMTTYAEAGYRPAHHVLGKKSHPFCASADRVGDCTIVEPARFDPKRGYVNAVGSLRAATPLVEIRTFSPLGEVLFSESDENGGDPLVSGTSSHESVCSPPINGSCRPDLRGESS